MRFSMRWMLAVTAYVALWRRRWVRAVRCVSTVVWAVTIIAIGYAVVVAVVDRGKRQAMAVGFVALAAAHIVCMYLAPTSLPAVRLLEAAGYGVNVQAGTIFWVDLSAPNQFTRGSGAVLPAESTRSRFPDDEWSGDARGRDGGVRCGDVGVSRNRQEEELDEPVTWPGGGGGMAECTGFGGTAESSISDSCEWSRKSCIFTPHAGQSTVRRIELMVGMAAT